ncbi:MFS transporter [Bacillus sp. WLY-B-L8]|nr:MFS transporter [Bacillus sp. WLY-B-L8]MDP7977827.1 MFS transporter [Bacillus sp. WLY-B-L8]
MCAVLFIIIITFRKFLYKTLILFFLLSVPSPFLSIIATFLLGITFNLSVVLAQIYIQHSCEEQYLGRVFATWTLLAVLGGGIGAYLSGLLHDKFDLKTAFFVTGLCMLLPLFINLLMTFHRRQQQKKIGM